MGKELEMARPKRGRPSVLLAGSRPRLPIYSSNRRNKREASTIINEETERGKTEDSTPEGKIGAEAKNLDAYTVRGTVRQRHRRHDKDRKPDNRAKGTDSRVWRSAEELGIDWLNATCLDHQPHYLIASHNIYEGVLFRCKHCKQQVWLPTSFEKARELDSLMSLHGVRKGYLRYLDRYRPAKVVLAKLQELRRAKKQNPSNGEFMLKVMEVMGDHNYGRV